ncbi:MAG: carbonic anhydrase [Alphaproteobacteria bacterium]|jgi:carbonic anhydrase|nr:carbonic anhydrase [Alphaproteobacteria bacterium]
MPALVELLAGYRRFRERSWAVEKHFYQELDSGQHPGVMVIGCADSRVDPAKIFDLVPGQAFVLRNVANLVPPYEEGGGLHGVSAALEFAVRALNVSYILVMGHQGCGGIRAALDTPPGSEPSGEFIAPWVEIIGAIRDRVMQENPGASREELSARLEFEAIRGSLDNLMTFPFVREAVEADRLALRGGLFTIATGQLHWCDPQDGRFTPIGA